MGEKLLSERVTITSDPADPVVPETLGAKRRPETPDGLVRERRRKNASCSRYWAQKTGQEPVPRPPNLSMAGGAVAVEDMIREVKRGILVTRFWYMNIVDPRTLLSTGMTRDGNFLIENGKITAPALNLRFNESPVSALRTIEAMGPAVRAIGGNSGSYAVCAPPLMIKSFTFSSKSSGI